MTSITYTHTSIQTSTQSVLSPPGWLGEVVLIVEHLRKLGVLAAINEQVAAGNKTRGITGEKDGRRGNFLRVPEAAKQVLCADLLPGRLEAAIPI